MASAPLVLLFAEAFAAFLASILIPAAIAIALVGLGVPRSNARYAAAFALGVFVLYISDTFADSAYLDLNSGFNGGSYQLVLVILMAAGLLGFFAADSDLFGTAGPKAGLFVPFMVALALGIHGFGEGSAFGSTAASTSQAALLSAFGGLGEASSFVLHKTLEATVVGACYLMYRSDSAAPARRLKEYLLLLLAFAGPGIIGSATGYYLSYDTTYVFALAFGASFFVLARISKALFGAEGAPGKGKSSATALFILLGFLFIYAAALLHS